MTKYELLRNNHPLLKVPLTNVGECADREQIKNDLIEVMKEHNGVGLSANQVGLMERVFVMY
ncbi:MAG: peptide deformylase, partial [Anaerolineales bacterium]|nr:peptide deformylase [Anaerolineales bacterium]